MQGVSAFVNGINVHGCLTWRNDAHEAQRRADIAVLGILRTARFVVHLGVVPHSVFSFRHLDFS
jgi:hypothetical protein